MSKIARYAGNLRAFGSNAQGSERTLFGETTQADDLTSQITASFLRGWGVVGPSENPSLEDFNAAMYTMSQFIAYQHQMGVPEWDSRQEYYVGSICVHDGDSYISLADGNTNSKPPSAKWTTVLTAKNALANITGFLKAKNNLSEIKDAGPEAVAQTLLNLGLGDVIRKSDTKVQLLGQLTTKGNIKSTEGDLYSGDARLAHDGNIFGTVWGDSLFHYLDGKLPKVITLYPDGTESAPYNFPTLTMRTYGNPFPGRQIACRLEVLQGGIWGHAPFAGAPTAGGSPSYGVNAEVAARPADGLVPYIVVQSGKSGAFLNSSESGGPHGYAGGILSTIPIRLVVWTID